MDDYAQWTQQQLIARIQHLEAQLNTQDQAPDLATQHVPDREPPKTPAKPFDFSRYSTRLVAFKFAYLGQRYNGFEHHKNNTTPLPTIEEELWKALAKTRLINPTPSGRQNGGYGRVNGKTTGSRKRAGAEVNWDECEYSKCGRTDRGVSAFGQVIGIRVRSNRPLSQARSPIPEEASERIVDEGETLLPSHENNNGDVAKAFDELHDELPYMQLLNRVLPPDIRIYAWCPNPPPDFSARFSCKERRYKYFFTNPSFAPVPGSAGFSSTSADQSSLREGWLDIEKMRAACKELVGLHDFRNFCKIDASKQLTNFKRRIFHADIEEISPLSIPSCLSHSALQSPSSAEAPKMYAFVLHGSAFLWHQVRSLVAILFLVGQGLESPSIIPALLDISSNPTRPKYEMASDAPLVLWDCVFPHEHEVQSSEDREHGYQDRLNWVYVGDDGGIEPRSKKERKGNGPSPMGLGKWGRGGVIDDIWEMWRGNKIDETLSALLLDAIASQGKATPDSQATAGERTVGTPKGGPRIFDGGNIGKARGSYTEILKRERQESVEVVNERYARKRSMLDSGGAEPKVVEEN
ncbi:pseudouridylate synthase-like protein 3 [Massariosphaeria phaeospora]|uniref:Pseudouridylate synthase-like protein 3 n=1 Tax=Massariosphaeria phaeospora TaxID=100035 RepID=A0A7C8IDM7_9PLEO|nr:pseudouridylate synthase-like protein 3 [Massariosphaeria phaeospora]